MSSRVRDESSGQAPVQKREDVIGIERTVGEIGAGDEQRISTESPAFDHAIEELLSRSIALENPQHEQGCRTRSRRPPPTRIRQHHRWHPQQRGHEERRGGAGRIHRGGDETQEEYSPHGREDHQQFGHALARVSPAQGTPESTQWPPRYQHRQQPECHEREDEAERRRQRFEWRNESLEPLRFTASRLREQPQSSQRARGKTDERHEQPGCNRSTCPAVEDQRDHQRRDGIDSKCDQDLPWLGLY